MIPRAGWLLILIIILSVGVLIVRAPAHDAPSGWQYPVHCCHDSDCGPALSAIRNNDGSLTVTTRHGTATFPASFKHEPSPDGMIHACFTPWKLYCLYLSAGI